MSTFEAPVVRVVIEPHPNADAIEIARVGDFQSIVRKGQFKTGDLAVYLPESALLPAWMLKQLGMWDDVNARGKLSGSAGNRIKAIKLRGVLSQGVVLGGGQVTYGAPGSPIELDGVDSEAIILRAGEGVEPQQFDEGECAAAYLGVTKYEPRIPAHFAGRIAGADLAATHKYDFENIKKNPGLFDDGEPVVITEKIHGTLLQIGVVPSRLANSRYFDARALVTSKGMGGKGLILDHTDETNVYAKVAKKYNLFVNMLGLYASLADQIDKPVFLLGEVYGAGVQDLTYGGEGLQLRAFDISIGNRGAETYLPWAEFERACALLGVERVPVLHIGPYSRETLLDLTDGPETVSADGGHHIREGVVVKSAIEARHPRYGRKIAKSISDAYLLRKGEVTEYQ